MDHASPFEADGDRPTELLLYGRPGCGLCDETRATLEALLARRVSMGQPTATLVERDIGADPALERQFLAEIPVIELGGRRLILATSPARIERLIADVLDR
ncbi:MAG: glutaredoxin family protein [Chloroflexota bacterium]|nr:glutaredoxin family protein [Chloroflexota bacterium]